MKTTLKAAAFCAVALTSAAASATTVKKTYYELAVQPLTTRIEGTQGIQAYNLIPFLPLPAPPPETGDDLYVNSFLFDFDPTNLFWGFVGRQVTIEQLRAQSIGSMHTLCTWIGGAYPEPLFKATNNPAEAPGLVTKCTQVANIGGHQLVFDGLSNNDAFEGNWEQCWPAGQEPVPSTLAVTGGTGAFKRARGEMRITGVKLWLDTNRNGQMDPGDGDGVFEPGEECLNPGPVKKLDVDLSLF